MNRIALFRYHNNIEGCINRLRFFKQMQPKVPVIGLFGGNENEFEHYNQVLSDWLDNNYCINNHTALWKWKNGDLAVQEWFRDQGHEMDFDVVHMLEWDLLLFAPLDELHRDIPNNGIGMAGLTPLEKVKKKWFWVRNCEQQQQWEALKKFLFEKWQYEGPYLASVAPGMFFSRKFLEDFAQYDIPDWGNDEIRLPNLAQAMGYPVHHLGFFKRWFSKREWRYFNCNDMEIADKTIHRELKKKDGRRVFHPYRQLVDLEKEFLSES